MNLLNDLYALICEFRWVFCLLLLSYAIAFLGLGLECAVDGWRLQDRQVMGLGVLLMVFSAAVASLGFLI